MENENQDEARFVQLNERVNMFSKDDDDDDGDDCADPVLKSTKPKKTAVEQLQTRKNELLKRVVEINTILDVLQTQPNLLPVLKAARKHYFQ